jgi:predicted nucleic acid-binding protein
MADAVKLPAKLIIHTDVFLDFLLHKKEQETPVLRFVLKHSFCYTTVFTAIELFSLARTPQEMKAVEQSMGAVKLLGLNARSAKIHGALLSGDVRLPRMNLLIAGICIESRLPIVAVQPNEFLGVKQVRVLSARSLMKPAR